VGEWVGRNKGAVMRILHLGKYYPPYRGGMESVLRDLCERHASRARVTALVSNTNRETIEEERGGVRVVRVGCRGTPFSVPIVPGLPRWLRRTPADVIVHHEPNPVALLSYLSVRPQAPLVVWFHSDIVRQRLFYWTYRPFLRRVLERAQAIVVASPNHVRYTPILNEFSKECLVIPYGIDRARFSPTAEVTDRAAAIRAEHPLPIVLFVGRFAYYKGISYLVQAMRDVSARLILAGAGPLHGQIRQLAKSVASPGVIEFAGEVPDAEIVALMHACDVFVLPSVERSEAFGIVQVEAMACRKPVVSCRIPSGVPWVNRDGITGLTVRPADSGALAQAINRLLGDEVLRRRLGENGRERVHREFTIERMTDSFWEVLTAARSGRGAEAYRYDPGSVAVVG
jgi:rhamnosyl/mannosyltransferase